MLQYLQSAGEFGPQALFFLSALLFAGGMASAALFGKNGARSRMVGMGLPFLACAALFAAGGLSLLGPVFQYLAIPFDLLKIAIQFGVKPAGRAFQKHAFNSIFF